MPDKIVLTHTNVQDLATLACTKMVTDKKISEDDFATVRLFGVPRGGVPAVYAVSNALITGIGVNAVVVENHRQADIVIDDIVDSGATRDKYGDLTGGKPFYALVDKTDKDHTPFADKWIVFPWEEAEGNDTSQDDVPIRLLSIIGEDPNRGGLIETPKRFLKAWNYWTKGYDEKPEDILKVFEDGAEDYDQMVTVANIPFYSKCEHHLADIIGRATVSYIPNKEAPKVVGLSKLSRLVDMFGRRLQVQERLTNQIADALVDNLGAQGVGVHIRARHMCMESRGVCQQGHHTVTTALRGVIKEEREPRAEFLAEAQNAVHQCVSI